MSLQSELVDAVDGTWVIKMKLQTKESNAVSLKPELQSTFADAYLSKSPVKIKANFKDNSKQNIEMGKSCTVKFNY